MSYRYVKINDYKFDAFANLSSDVSSIVQDGYHIDDSQEWRVDLHDFKARFEEYDKLYKLWKNDNSTSSMPIFITNLPLYDDAGEQYWVYNAKEFIFISIHKVITRALKSSKNVYRYILSSTITSFIQAIPDLDIPYHKTLKHCPHDYCYNEKDLVKSLLHHQFCSACISKLNIALRKDHITIKQYAALLRIVDRIAEREVCFVIMPMNKSFKELSYKNILKPIIRKCGYEVYRGDEGVRSPQIHKNIAIMIERANVIVAVLAQQNANVYYECGMAHALSKDIILLKSKNEPLPFDISKEMFITYGEECVWKRTIKKLLYNKKENI